MEWKGIVMIEQHQASGWKCIGYGIVAVVLFLFWLLLLDVNRPDPDHLVQLVGFAVTITGGLWSIVLCFQHYVASTARNDARRNRTARNGNIVAAEKFREVILHGPVPEGMELVRMGFISDPVLRPVDQGTERPLIDFFSPNEIAAAEWRREFVRLAELPAFHPDDDGHHPLPNFDDPRWGSSPRAADEKVQELRIANLPADGDCGEKPPEGWEAVCFGK